MTPKSFYFRVNYLTAIIISLLPVYSHADEMAFNPALLEVGTPQGEKGAVDLHAFENGGQPPGKYQVQILVNDDEVETRDVEFYEGQDRKGQAALQPCLDVEWLKGIGVKVDSYPGIKGENGCANLSAIPDAFAEFLFSRQQLRISIPQKAITSAGSNAVAESSWDEGVPALLLNYSASGSKTDARVNGTDNTRSQYINLRPGLNVGPWRFRNYTTWQSDNSTAENKWDSVYNYIQRDIRALKSELTLGDSSSPSDVFDSMPFRGAQLASDDEMLPDNMKGYAPVVRGIAHSSAEVTIRQNGYTIYQTNVSPGAFEITDMYPTGGSGDLYVTVTESDGSEQQFVVPYASLPVLQREGHLRYAFTVGRYRAYDSQTDDTPLGIGSAIYGLPHGFTVYGGAEYAAERYQAMAMGLGKNFGPLGAVSGDVTTAKASLNNGIISQGQSWRVRYSKNFVDTGTNFAIAGYRYSTSGYYSMQEALDTYNGTQDEFTTERRRNRSELTLNQSLGTTLGSLSINLVSEDYWGSGRRNNSVNLGYNNSYNGISYGINYSRNRTEYGDNTENENTISLNLSVPLERWLPGAYANYNMSNTKTSTTQNLGLSANNLDGRLNWSVMEGRDSADTGVSTDLNADYKGSHGELSGGFSRDNQSQRINYQLSGGIVAHEHGVTFSQPLGETIALVEVPGAAGVNVSGETGIKTDSRGYAVVPYVSPYRRNKVSLSPDSLPDDVDITQFSQNAVPTRGAVVRVKYNANIGSRVLMTLKHPDGSVLPFGAIVSGNKHDGGFIVGEDGLVYLTGLDESGDLKVTWGAENTCHATYHLAPASSISSVREANAVCQ